MTAGVRCDLNWGMSMDNSMAVVGAIRDEFTAQRRTAEKAIGQLDDAQIRVSIDGELNSVIVIVKHMAGNLRSRFTNFLTEDGEKPWRERDNEFVDDFAPGEAGRAAAMERWNEGWACVLDALAALSDADLERQVAIRGESQTAIRALTRSLAHTAHHVGQIVILARSIVGPTKWKTISIPRGGSAAYNESVGYRAERP